MIRAIIFDYAYTIYDPEKNGFQRDVRPTLEELMKVCKLILISRTTDIEARLKQIDEVGFQLYFDYVDVIGKDDKKDFSKVLNHYNFKPDEYLVVGDRITS
jgi:FMN phosphatase YigB (HAD superfamily)